MGEASKIEWCDHTFNPWVGCTKVSPACDHCYAEGWAKRTGQPHLWTGERRRTSAANWQQPLRWERAAAAFLAEHGRRQRVFCASLADVFDNQVPRRWRDDLWHRIDQTPSLDWLLLTKRPQNIAKMLPTPDIGAPAWGDGWPNVWLGTTVENQTEADRRVPELLDVPAAVRFLSCEPLLGAVNLTTIDLDTEYEVLPLGAGWLDRLGYGEVEGPRINWVIAGGESGPKARPTHPDWARGLRDQCAGAGVPFFFKQWGEWVAELQSPEDIILPGESRMPWAEKDRDGEWSKGDRTGVFRVGKKAAGRLLDGREHNEFPARAA